MSFRKFIYEWSGNNSIVGAFSAVNESTWEHLKLLFFPMLITIIISYFGYNGRKSNFVCAKVKGILASMIFTVVFFYTYMGVLGTNYAWLNILTFYVAVVIGEYVSYRQMQLKKFCNTKIAWLVLIVLFICFITFTYHAPEIGLFKDPISGGYGIISDLK